MLRSITARRRRQLPSWRRPGVRLPPRAAGPLLAPGHLPNLLRPRWPTARQPPPPPRPASKSHAAVWRRVLKTDRLRQQPRPSFCFSVFSALDDGFLLDLDPMSSSKGTAATSSVTGWGGEDFWLSRLRPVWWPLCFHCKRYKRRPLGE